MFENFSLKSVLPQVRRKALKLFGVKSFEHYYAGELTPIFKIPENAEIVGRSGNVVVRLGTFKDRKSGVSVPLVVKARRFGGVSMEGRNLTDELKVLSAESKNKVYPLKIRQSFALMARNVKKIIERPNSIFVVNHVQHSGEREAEFFASRGVNVAPIVKFKLEGKREAVVQADLTANGKNEVFEARNFAFSKLDNAGVLMKDFEKFTSVEFAKKLRGEYGFTSTRHGLAEESNLSDPVKELSNSLKHSFVVVKPKNSNSGVLVMADHDNTHSQRLASPENWELYSSIFKK